MAFKKLSEYNAERYGNKFVLRNDGDSADVIFLFRSEDDVMAAEAHYINSADYSGYVHCNGRGCPACAKGIRVQHKLFVPVYNVTNQQIEFWDRSIKFENQLKRDVFSMYPNPSEYVFKITRKGQANDINTIYEIRVIAANNLMSYDEILRSVNSQMPDYYETIIKEFDSSTLYDMLNVTVQKPETDLPSYKIIPRNGANIGAFDAVKGVADIEEDEDDDLEEPNFD